MYSKLRKAEVATNTLPWTPLLTGCMLKSKQLTIGWEGMNQVTYLKLESDHRKF